jgi:hypothetical protein
MGRRATRVMRGEYVREYSVRGEPSAGDLAPERGGADPPDLRPRCVADGGGDDVSVSHAMGIWASFPLTMWWKLCILSVSGDHPACCPYASRARRCSRVIRH